MFSKVKRFFKNLSFICRIVWESSNKIVVSLIFIVILQVFTQFVPMFITKELINLITASSDVVVSPKIIILLVVGLMLCGVIFQLLSQLKDMMSLLLQSKVSKHVNYIIQQKCAELDLSFFDSPEYFAKLENAKRAINRPWYFLILIPIEVGARIVSLIALILILSSFKIWLAPLVFIGVIPGLIAQIKSKKKETDFYSDEIPETIKIKYSENLLMDKKNVKEIKIFNLSDYFINLSKSLFNFQYLRIKKLKKSILVMNSISGFITSIIILGCHIYISLAAIAKTIMVGDWQFYTNTVQSIQSTVSVIFYYLSSGMEDELFVEILMEFLNSDSKIDSIAGMKYPDDGKPPIIEFRDVTYTYRGGIDPVIKNLSFTINPKEKIGIVGFNGAGKSTMIKLLMRLYEPDSGEILFNGINIKKYKASELYKLFSVVFQDFSKFAFTLKENIGISNLEDMDNINPIIEASINAGVDSISSKYPKGYDTYISKEYDLNGCSDLSGGEWLKIAIARGFFKKSPIIVLDEPNSALDIYSEQRIINRLVELCSDKTAIMITHRLSNIRNIDRIFFFKDGALTEVGTHDYLISINGDYAKLFNIQAEKYKIKT